MFHACFSSPHFRWGLLCLLCGRWIVRHYLTRARSRGRAMTPTVVVGDAREVSLTLRDLGRHPGAGYHPVAICIEGPSPSDADVSQLEGHLLVPESQIASLVETFPHAAVVIAGGVSRAAARRLAW